jgi:MerR family transcriptional regulator, copper efflux regulator
MGERTLSIGALARECGVGVQTIRYYERIGLLSQRGRTKGTYRRYGADELARLKFIRRSAQLGFTLAETSELLALRAREGAPCSSVRTKAERKLAAIERKLAELTSLRDAVATLVHACAGDTAIEHCSILAALESSDEDTTPKEGKLSCQPPSPRRRQPPRPASPASKRARSASKTA